MDKALAFLAHELREAALPAAFFFVAFLIGAITKALILESYGLTLGNPVPVSERMRARR